MARADQIPLQLRIVIDNPVAGVLHSLQAKDGHPLYPKRSTAGEPLAFDVPIRIAPGPKYFGDQVRREGPERRFIYVRIGQSAGDLSSPWTRRMKIDIHDLAQSLLDQAVATGRPIEISVNGTAKDASPACATVRPTSRRLAARGGPQRRKPA
ncbi:MAG: DUF5990 family protein [Sphingomicrobium sp.]